MMKRRMGDGVSGRNGEEVNRRTGESGNGGIGEPSWEGAMLPTNNPVLIGGVFALSVQEHSSFTAWSRLEGITNED